MAFELCSRREKMIKSENVLLIIFDLMWYRQYIEYSPYFFPNLDLFPSFLSSFLPSCLSSIIPYFLFNLEGKCTNLQCFLCGLPPIYFGDFINFKDTFYKRQDVNPLNAELNPICYLLALLGAHHFLHVSRVRVKGHAIFMVRISCPKQ